MLHFNLLQVVVECFAPYDDHRWVNIGKEKNGMAPDAVQYARALRPPYQLLSFLRIKGNCAKGMGCSNKNTMVSKIWIYILEPFIPQGNTIFFLPHPLGNFGENHSSFLIWGSIIQLRCPTNKKIFNSKKLTKGGILVNVKLLTPLTFDFSGTSAFIYLDT